jgi:uncharacterized protein
MVFRRKRRPFLVHAKEMFWPSMGWGRTFQYYKLRLARLDDSPECISVGMASGVAVSFIPVPIIQFFLAAMLAAILRGNLTAAVLATLVANPWTIPFMWYSSYRVGIWLYGQMGITNLVAPPDDLSLSSLWALIRAEPLELMVPWVSGAIVIGLVIWPIAYFFFRALVIAERIAYKKQRTYLLHHPHPHPRKS